MSAVLPSEASCLSHCRPGPEWCASLCPCLLPRGKRRASDPSVFDGCRGLRFPRQWSFEFLSPQAFFSVYLSYSWPPAVFWSWILLSFLTQEYSGISLFHKEKKLNFTKHLLCARCSSRAVTIQPASPPFLGPPVRHAQNPF